GGGHVEAAERQVLGDAFAAFGVVFDDEDGEGHFFRFARERHAVSKKRTRGPALRPPLYETDVILRRLCRSCTNRLARACIIGESCSSPGLSGGAVSPR